MAQTCDDYMEMGPIVLDVLDIIEEMILNVEEKDAVDDEQSIDDEMGYENEMESEEDENAEMRLAYQKEQLRQSRIAFLKRELQRIRQMRSPFVVQMEEKVRLLLADYQNVEITLAKIITHNTKLETKLYEKMAYFYEMQLIGPQNLYRVIGNRRVKLDCKDKIKRIAKDLDIQAWHLQNFRMAKNWLENEIEKIRYTAGEIERLTPKPLESQMEQNLRYIHGEFNTNEN